MRCFLHPSTVNIFAIVYSSQDGLGRRGEVPAQRAVLPGGGSGPKGGSWSSGEGSSPERGGPAPRGEVLPRWRGGQSSEGGGVHDDNDTGHMYMTPQGRPG